MVVHWWQLPTNCIYWIYITQIVEMYIIFVLSVHHKMLHAQLTTLTWELLKTFIDEYSHTFTTVWMIVPFLKYNVVIVLFHIEYFITKQNIFMKKRFVQETFPLLKENPMRPFMLAITCNYKDLHIVTAVDQLIFMSANKNKWAHIMSCCCHCCKSVDRSFWILNKIILSTKDHFGQRHCAIVALKTEMAHANSHSAPKVNLRPMEFAYRAPVVGIVDANLAILSSDLHSGDK